LITLILVLLALWLELVGWLEEGLVGGWLERLGTLCERVELRCLCVELLVWLELSECVRLELVLLGLV